MNLIIVHRNKETETGGGESLLRSVLIHNPAAQAFMRGFGKYYSGQAGRASFLPQIKKHGDYGMLYAVPNEWSVPNVDSKYKYSIVTYNGNIPIPSQILDEKHPNKNRNKWFIISNGRYFTKFDEKLLYRLLDNLNVDVISVNVEPGLLGDREKMQLTPKGKVAGFRRLYSDSVTLSPVPDDWPAHLFIRSEVFNKFLTDGTLSLSFSEIRERSRENSMKIRAVNLGGTVLDLENENDLLTFCRIVLDDMPKEETAAGNSVTLAGDSRLKGKVLLGKNITIGPKVRIIGPSIICDNAKINEGSIISSSIIGSNICIPCESIFHNRIVMDKSKPEDSYKKINISFSNYPNVSQGAEDRFRLWPIYSYARFFKRVADIFAAAVVLILFTPLMLVIAAAIKLTSPGPIFYRDKRQGLHGKNFNCLKFRTMITGANKIQEKLRFISQVDGPQFKMADDPRISFVGRFLRETYIDEIPQFVNVLLGQMSVVGPRPSPESENTLCPFWRDARLSVRPGITGLWQLYRTRRPMKDFQEWIYYDTEYVKNLSLRMDLSVCWKTAKKLINDFISQF